LSNYWHEIKYGREFKEKCTLCVEINSQKRWQNIWKDAFFNYIFTTLLNTNDATELLKILSQARVLPQGFVLLPKQPVIVFFLHYTRSPQMPTKKQKTVEPFWNELVEVYFSFCKEKFSEAPSFDGSSPRDFKSVIKSLHERAERSNVEWTQETATNRLKNFLEFAYRDNWLKSNFLLSNINRQKDKIFFNIRAAMMRQPSNSFE
jgi:hypothetical protein